MRVVIAYDGSPGADLAVSLADAIRWPPDSLLRVVSVAERAMAAAPPMSPGPVHVPADADRQVEDYHEERAVEAARTLQSDLRRVENVVRHGRPATVLVDEAIDLGADLVIGGSRGLGRIARLLLGSVSAEMVDHAPCPVLIARRPAIRRVLLATDGSAASAAAEKVVSTWSMFEDVPIRVVSVADVVEPWHTGIAPTMYREAMAAHAKDVADATTEHTRIAESVAARLRAAGRAADTTTPVGDAAAEIAAAAEDWDADLVVVGSRGLTGISRMVLGSVARNLLNASSRSVLVVHPEATTPDR
jgi:nucleotide-binding universal stress UspA family protein